MRTQDFASIPPPTRAGSPSSAQLRPSISQARPPNRSQNGPKNAEVTDDALWTPVDPRKARCGYKLDLGDRELSILSDRGPSLRGTPRGTLTVSFPRASVSDVLAAFFDAPPEGCVRPGLLEDPVEVLRDDVRSARGACRRFKVRLTPELSSVSEIRQTIRDLGAGRGEMELCFETGRFQGQTLRMRFEETRLAGQLATKMSWNADDFQATPPGLAAQAVLFSAKLLGSTLGSIPLVGTPMAFAGMAARMPESIATYERDTLLKELATGTPLRIEDRLARTRKGHTRGPIWHAAPLCPPAEGEHGGGGLYASDRFYLGKADPQAFIDRIARDPALILPTFAPSVTLGGTVYATAQGGTYEIAEVHHDAQPDCRKRSSLLLRLGGVANGQVRISAETTPSGELVVTDRFEGVSVVGGARFTRIARMNHSVWIADAFRKIAEDLGVGRPGRPSSS